MIAARSQSDSPLNRVTEIYADSGGGSIVARCEARRGFIIPVAIEGEIPIEFAPDFDVVGRVYIELNSTRVREGREHIGGSGQGGFVEAKQPYVCSYEACSHLLRVCGHYLLPVIDLLEGEAAVNGEEITAGVLDISSDASTKRLLPLNSLNGTLEKVKNPDIVPIVPSHELLAL